MKKLATASTIERIQAYINAFWYSESYRVDPATLAITNPHRDPPAGYAVKCYRGGFMFYKVTA